MSENTFILRLFPFLIGDIAHLWQKAILIGSISTWDECKRVFIFKFFFTYRTARIHLSNASWIARKDTSIHYAQVHEAMPYTGGGQLDVR